METTLLNKRNLIESLLVVYSQKEENRKPALVKDAAAKFSIDEWDGYENIMTYNYRFGRLLDAAVKELIRRIADESDGRVYSLVVPKWFMFGSGDMNTSAGGYTCMVVSGITIGVHCQTSNSGGVDKFNCTLSVTLNIFNQ